MYYPCHPTKCKASGTVELLQKSNGEERCHYQGDPMKNHAAISMHRFICRYQ